MPWLMWVEGARLHGKTFKQGLGGAVGGQRCRPPPVPPLLQVGEWQAEGHANKHDCDHQVRLRVAARRQHLGNKAKAPSTSQVAAACGATLRKYFVFPSRPGPSKS